MDGTKFWLLLNRIRGMLAISVLLSHVWGITGFMFLIPFNKLVTVAVFLFFFLSGLGLEKSNMKKEYYGLKIIKEKIPLLVLMSLMAYFFAVLFEMLMNIVYGGGQNTYLPISLKNYFVSTNWYVYELSIFYFLFSLMYRLSVRFRVLILWVVSILLFGVFYRFAPVEAWYDSTFGFVLGVTMFHLDIVQQRSNKIIRVLIDIAVVGIIVLAAFGMILGKTGTLWFAITRNLIGAVAVYLIYIIYVYVGKLFEYILQFKVNKWFCRISPELYFYHLPICAIVGYSMPNKAEAAIYIITISIITAATFSKIDAVIKKLLVRVERKK